MTAYTIRPFRHEDREAVLAFRNRDRPAHQQATAAEWERDDARRPAEEAGLRLCAGNPPVAYLNAVDLGTTARRKPGACGFTLWVARERRAQGIGSALYNEAVRFACSRRLTRLETWVSLDGPHEPGGRFLEKRGFVEADRLVPGVLSLTAFDRRQFQSPAPAGIAFFSYAGAGDSQENRRRLYKMALILDHDVPAHDHPEPLPFEEFVKHFDRPEWHNDTLMLAANDSGEWVGVSQLRFQEQTNIARTFLTVVLPKYRGQGIALALKLLAIDAAIARGCPLITTENHEGNAPMRAINRKLGFVPDAPSVSYMKVI